jgi:hypothetical protein
VAAPIVRRLAPRTGLVEGVQQAAERGFQLPEPREEAGRLFRESVRTAGEPIIGPAEEAVSGATSATEQAIGAPPGSLRAAAEDVSGVLGPATTVVGMVRRAGQEAGLGARAARGAQQAIRMTPEEQVGRLRLDKFPAPLRPAIQEAAEATEFGAAARRGVIPDQAAEQMADEVGKSVDDWISRSRIGQSLNTEETRALRNVVTGQAERVQGLGQEIADAESRGVVTDRRLTRAHQEGEKLASLVSVMEGARAEAGRTLRAWIADTRPTDPGEAAQRIYRKFGGGPEGRQRAIDAVKEFNAIPADDPIARAQFWARVERGGQITGSDVLTAIRYNSMLSSPRTWEVGWLGSLLQLPLKAASDVIAAAARPMSGELGEAARGAARGAVAGVRPLAETIQHGITTEQALAGQLPRGLAARATSTPGRVAGTLVDLPGRMVAAPDAFFSSLFREAETGRQAAIAAHEARRSLAPAERAAFDRAGFIRDFMANPPKEAATEIERVVDDLMLRGDMGRVGRYVNRLTTSDPLIGSFVAPFMKVAYKSWTQGLDLTPVGALGTAADVARGAYRGGGRPQGVRPLAERLRYNALGLGITGAATWQALQGNVSGIGPDDPEKRDQLRATGWQPYSVRIGDRWVSYANWGPVAVPLALAAAYAENRQYRKADAKPEDELFDMASRVGRLVTEQTFLQGIGDVVNAIEDPQRYGPRLLSGQLSSLIPYGAGLSTVAQAFDPLNRRPDRPADVGMPESVRQAVAARVPGLREQVPAAQDPLGRPVPNPLQGPLAFQPFRISPERPDPTIRLFQEGGVDIPRPKDALTIDGTKLELTPDEQREWQRLRGEQIERRAGPLGQRASWASMPQERKHEYLRDILAAAGEAADLQLRRSLGSAEVNRRLRDVRQAERAAGGR